jgi:NADPH-dependent 2,4-dienoyl-CoA reductase/sulfur reductase-like enzyme
MNRYVIIGSGAAGIAALEAIRQADPIGDVYLISNEVEGYYSRPGLAYYLTGEIGEKMLFPFSKKDFHGLQVKLIQTGTKSP